MRVSPAFKKQLVIFSLVLLTGLAIWVSSLVFFFTQTRDPVAIFLIGLAPSLGTALVLPSLVIVFYDLKRMTTVGDRFFWITMACIFAAMMIAHAVHMLVFSSLADTDGLLLSAGGAALIVLCYLLSRERKRK